MSSVCVEITGAAFFLLLCVTGRRISQSIVCKGCEMVWQWLYRKCISAAESKLGCVSVGSPCPLRCKAISLVWSKIADNVQVMNWQSVCFLFLGLKRLFVYIFMQSHKVTFQRTFNHRLCSWIVLSFQGQQIPMHTHMHGHTHAWTAKSTPFRMNQWINKPEHTSLQLAVYLKEWNSMAILCLCSVGCTHAMPCMGVEKTQPIPLGVNSSRALPPYQTISYQWLLMGLAQCITWRHPPLVTYPSSQK